MNRRDLFNLQPQEGESYQLTKDTVFQQYANKVTPQSTYTSTGLEPYAGSWGTPQVLHILRRLTFGAKLDDYYQLIVLNADAAVDALLAPATSPSPPLNNYSVNGYIDPTGVNYGSTWVNAPYGDGNVNARRSIAYRSWWMIQMCTQALSIEEKMILFWHNHFATETGEVGDARYSYKHNALLREHALGNFKVLVKSITRDPSMLRYLNGSLNKKGNPDENYARELQELFTVGKGPNSKYTENDVREAARVLTGWRDDKDNNTSYFDSTRHDTDTKQFSAFYNYKKIVGKTGIDGATETDELIDMIFYQQEVSKYICRRLYRFFVYYVIDQNIEDTIITPLADLFRASNYEIRPVLSKLFKSAHFFDSQNMGCYIKTPIDHVVGMVRQCGIKLPPSNDYSNYYIMGDFLRSTAATMQMDLGQPPNVAGWPAFYQEPVYYESWINSDTLPKRIEFSDIMIQNGHNVGGIKYQVDVLALSDSLPNAEDPDQLIANAWIYFCPIEISATIKTTLKNILLSNQADNHYWTDAWLNYKNDPSNTMTKNIVLTRLRDFYTYLFQLAEFQLS